MSIGGGSAVDDIATFLAKINFGTLPGWLQLAVWVLILWRGVPTFLDAITNRQSKIEERMEARLKEADERYLKQIEAADRRHDECIKGQEKLQARVAVLEGQVDKLHEENAGLKRQIVGSQASAIRAAPDEVVTPLIRGMVENLGRQGL